MTRRAIWLPAAILLLAGVLLLAVPLVLCMPVWADVYLYDLAARNVLQGGVAYRDIFDTNFPGMVWLHVFVRSIFGWSSEALRAVDLLVVGASLMLMVAWPVRLSSRGRVLLVACGFAVYFVTGESCHVQRDVWMLLPALSALRLRQMQVDRLRAGQIKKATIFRWALGEGIVWGLAFWIKPFVAIPALACWVVGWLLARRQVRDARPPFFHDLLGLFVGGSMVIVLGVLWLLATGAWSSMLEVFTQWNPEYLTRTPEWGPRLLFPLIAFLPWGFVHLLAVPLAVVRLNRDVRSGQSFSLFAAFYLAWLAQSFLIQKGLTYMLVPPLLLAVVLVGDGIGRLRRPEPVWAVFLLLVGLGMAREPFFRPERLALWNRCWREGSSPDLRDRLGLMPNDNNPDWTDLARVAEFLRGLDLHDGELTCYHNSPLSLYLDLNLRPSTRYLHFNTMLMAFPRHQEDVRAALAASPQRYVVSDLRGLGLTREQAAVTTDDPLALPPTVPRPNRRCFPWNEPIVFRAGRYLVQRVTGPVQPLLPQVLPTRQPP